MHLRRVCSLTNQTIGLDCVRSVTDYLANLADKYVEGLTKSMTRLPNQYPELRSAFQKYPRAVMLSLISNVKVAKHLSVGEWANTPSGFSVEVVQGSHKSRLLSSYTWQRRRVYATVYRDGGDGDRWVGSNA